MKDDVGRLPFGLRMKYLQVKGQTKEDYEKSSLKHGYTSLSRISGMSPFELTQMNDQEVTYL
jgi:hypothetical protein